MLRGGEYYLKDLLSRESKKIVKLVGRDAEFFLQDLSAELQPVHL